MVAVSGFEPELKGYEPFVLPLHYTATVIKDGVEPPQSVTNMIYNSVASWTVTNHHQCIGLYLHSLYLV